MKKIKWFVLVFCIAASYAEAQYSLQGILINSIKEPVANANVVLQPGNLKTITDNGGIFSFEKLPKGIYQLNIYSNGYQSVDTSINLQNQVILSLSLKVLNVVTDEVIVNASRANQNSGIAFETIDKKTLETTNLGQDIPYLLQLTPSAVVNSDAGTGIGYTGIRIRGSDASRINVSMNGVPLNDAESQQMYWVNLPDIASSTENIQVQRGAAVGASGTASFGGGINLLSNKLPSLAGAEIIGGIGSFNTNKSSITLSSGLLKEKFAFQGRMSRITSDGFIDRGSADLKSYAICGAYYGNKTMVRFNHFSGKEITYQSWNGVPKSRYDDDVQGMQDYIVRNGLNEVDANNLLTSGQTYNYYTYDNQVDDYKQNHYQLLLSQELSKSWLLNATAHYTKGSGYFEEYKSADSLYTYGIDDIIINDSTTISTSDLIRQRWLDNDFYGGNFNLQGNTYSWQRITLGASYSQYDGSHFGKVIWTAYNAGTPINFTYYDNEAVKKDASFFVRTENSLSKKFMFIADAQLRNFKYDFIGLNEDGSSAPQNVDELFLNGKLGLSYNPNSNHQLYTSVSLANNEPNRADYIESSINSRPKSEQLLDFETGYRYIKENCSFSANWYFMKYKDQLTLTGAVNDVGNYTRTNVDDSYRNGLELTASCEITKKLTVNGNITFSKNEIKNFKEYVNTYDINFNYINQKEISYNATTIAFSPAITSALVVGLKPYKNTEIQFINRYVGKQYLDNTESDERSLDAFYTADLAFNYTLKLKGNSEINFNFRANNIFDLKYAPNGYTYGYFYDDKRVSENFVYPQAGINFLMQVAVKI